MTRPPTAAERQRLRTASNLWRALIPLLLVVFVVVIFARPGSTKGNGIHVVDTVAPISAARHDAGFDVPAPVGLSTGWRATSTDFVPAATDHGTSFRIGYVTPKGGYAEYLVSNDAAPAVVAQYGPVTGQGSTAIAGVEWTKFVTDKNRTLLSRTSGKVTAVVTGSASDDELTSLAAALAVTSGAKF